MQMETQMEIVEMEMQMEIVMQLCILESRALSALSRCIWLPGKFI